jgi:hypothetical protein
VIGGPLALAAIYVPDAAGTRSPGLLTLAGALLYAAPLTVWLRYSRDIVSSGGLAAFVEASAGRRLGYAQAAVWAFSYFLYLPYTVTDIVYEMLAGLFPGIAPWRWLLELTLPLALVGVVLLGTMPAMRVLFASAALQLAILLVLGFARIRDAGAPAAGFTHPHHLVRGGAAVSLLLVCGSLPIFLGAEAAGGGRTLRRSLVIAAVVVPAYVLFAVFPLAGGPASLGRPLELVVGVGAAASVAGLIVAEYLALSRLLYAATRVPVRRLLTWIAIPFVAIDALSLLSPEAFDRNVLRPSLIALYLSQLVVFAVYPRYRRRRGELTVADVAIAAVAFAVMAWGLYRAVVAPAST